MPYSYYIYYRVDPAWAAIAEPRINQLLGTVKTSTGIAGRLLKKRGEPNLWMEVYENVADAASFESELEDAVGKLNAVELLQSGTGRHVECFEA